MSTDSDDLLRMYRAARDNVTAADLEGLPSTKADPVKGPDRTSGWWRLPTYVCRHCGYEVAPVDGDDDTNDNWYHLGSCEELCR